MGLFAYGTCELTNWAVIQGETGLVVVDMLWGVVLTGVIGLVSRLVYQKLVQRWSKNDLDRYCQRTGDRYDWTQ